MLRLVNWLARLCEFLLTCPYWAARFLFGTFIFNPRLGRLRLIVAPAMLYVLFALLLTYVYAPIRGAVGQIWMARVLSYADERSLGTAIYDVKGRFVGIFDPILDSEETGRAVGCAMPTPRTSPSPRTSSNRGPAGCKPISTRSTPISPRC
jgi:hypothetical protein